MATGLLASIVIPTRNRSGALDRTVRSLWRQTVGADRFEILIVDNASSDDTSECAARLQRASPARLRYRRLDIDSGPAEARNEGARLAIGSTKWCQRMHIIRRCSIGPSVLDITK